MKIYWILNSFLAGIYCFSFGLFLQWFSLIAEESFDSLKKKILTVWKGKFWQFEKENFDSLKRKFLTDPSVPLIPATDRFLHLHTIESNTKFHWKSREQTKSLRPSKYLWELYSPLNEVINKSRDLYLTVESNKTEKCL